MGKTGPRPNKWPSPEGRTRKGRANQTAERFGKMRGIGLIRRRAERQPVVFSSFWNSASASSH